MNLEIIKTALAHRLPLPVEPHNIVLRLFNGFTEGWPDLTIELYGWTAVLLNQCDPPEILHPLIPDISAWLHDELPFLRTILLKDRRAPEPESRRGSLLFGESSDTRIIENGVTYALDLTLNQDTSFYIDTRHLRQWLKENMADKRVLNTFAYTGSLGVAALAAGATRVIQTDRTRRFLEIARASTGLNKFPVNNKDFLAGDFYKITANLRKREALFNCVILDPPFFSASPKSRIDLLTQYHRLINKARPLIAHGGWLVAINNALFLSGQDYLASLNALCADGYMSIEALIPIPDDCTGVYDFAKQPYPANPSPFNHPTKIVILRVQRKDLKQ